MSLIVRISPIPKTVPIRLGLGYMLVSLFVVTSNPIAGYILDASNGNFRHMQIFCGVTLFVGGVIAFLVRLLFPMAM